MSTLVPFQNGSNNQIANEAYRYRRSPPPTKQLANRAATHSDTPIIDISGESDLDTDNQRNLQTDVERDIERHGRLASTRLASTRQRRYQSATLQSPLQSALHSRSIPQQQQRQHVVFRYDDDYEAYESHSALSSGTPSPTPLRHIAGLSSVAFDAVLLLLRSVVLCCQLIGDTVRIVMTALFTHRFAYQMSRQQFANHSQEESMQYKQILKKEPGHSHQQQRLYQQRIGAKTNVY